MHPIQHQLRLQKAQKKFVEHVRQRRYDENIFVPLETTQLWLCVVDRSKTCHLTAIPADGSDRPMTAVFKDDKATRDENSVTWLIFHKDNPVEQIGYISLFEFSPFNAAIPSAMLAYRLVESYRGKGYMSEALGAVISFAFEKLGLRTIEARVRNTNERSRGVVVRAGFKRVGSMRKAKWISGEIRIVENDIWVLRLEDWMKHFSGSLTGANL